MFVRRTSNCSCGAGECLHSVHACPVVLVEFVGGLRVAPGRGPRGQTPEKRPCGVAFDLTLAAVWIVRRVRRAIRPSRRPHDRRNSCPEPVLGDFGPDPHPDGLRLARRQRRLLEGTRLPVDVHRRRRRAHATRAPARSATPTAAPAAGGSRRRGSGAASRRSPPSRRSCRRSGRAGGRRTGSGRRRRRGCSSCAVLHAGLSRLVRITSAWSPSPHARPEVDLPRHRPAGRLVAAQLHRAARRGEQLAASPRA